MQHNTYVGDGKVALIAYFEEMASSCPEKSKRDDIVSICDPCICRAVYFAPFVSCRPLQGAPLGRLTPLCFNVM